MQHGSLDWILRNIHKTFLLWDIYTLCDDVFDVIGVIKS